MQHSREDWEKDFRQTLSLSVPTRGLSLRFYSMNKGRWEWYESLLRVSSSSHKTLRARVHLSEY